MADYKPLPYVGPLTPAGFSQLMLRHRAAAARLMEEAQLAGRKREARSCEAKLRSIDASIAKYGMQRYAVASPSG
jgi:hypothetical protein